MGVSRGDDGSSAEGDTAYAPLGYDGPDGPTEAVNGSTDQRESPYVRARDAPLDTRARPPTFSPATALLPTTASPAPLIP